MKLVGEMQTMIGEEMDEHCEGGLMDEEEGQMGEQEEEFDVATPIKFKKPINFEDMENSEEHWKILWAPKKSNSKSLA